MSYLKRKSLSFAVCYKLKAQPRLPETYFTTA
jgi:hypothetical protein